MKVDIFALSEGLSLKMEEGLMILAGKSEMETAGEGGRA
jgi:hypothetical protein